MFCIHSHCIRLIGSGIFAVLLIFFILPFFAGIHNAGNIAGTVGCILGIFFFAANPLAARLLQRIWENGFGHFLLCIGIGILGFGCILAIVISGMMIKSICDKPKEETPLVILGCQVRNNGPSLMLQRRLNAALAYLAEHPDVPVIVCGGQGSDEPMSEAECMYTYLTDHGIPADQIYQDTTSASTKENLQNAKAILEEHAMGTAVTIVTDGYHQLRASMIAKELSLTTDAVPCYTSWYLIPTYWVREWLGVCYQFVLG